MNPTDEPSRSEHMTEMARLYVRRLGPVRVTAGAVYAAYCAGYVEGLATQRLQDYGSEERHDRPRPFSHQHHHAHHGQAQSDEPAQHEGEFSHPHRHGRDGDHHR